VAAGAEANRRTADLRAALDERNAAAAARPVDPARVQRAEVGVAAAARRQWEAHNLYVKTAPEADAFRAGPAARKATIELIQRQQELVDAKLFHARATAELDAAMVTGNADRIRAAVDRAEPLQARVREAQAEVDALTRLAPDPNLAASLGAESLVPPPRERDEVLPVPAAGAAAAAPQPAPPPSGAPSSPGAPARPQLPGARLRSTRPEGLSGNDPSASRPLAGRVGDGGPLDRETRKHMLVERARQRRAGGGTRELRGSIDDAVEDSIVEETGITPDPAVQPRLPRPQSRGRGKAARAAFRSLRDDYAGELGVTEGGQVHHAIELQVLDRYPGVFTEAELNSFENMRGIATENNRRRQLHNSHVRRRWDRAYRALNAAIRSRRLQPGSPEYRAVVRTSLEDARREIDTFNGTMFTEYRSGRQTGGTSRDDAEDRSE
jgi:hypothetical protein